MKRTIVGLCLAALVSTAWALPSVQDVETATRQGRYTEAETMMAEVVAAKPGSARAHYIYAELLAHNANFARASEEAAKARQIDPKIGFADPDKFRTFEQELERQRTPAPQSSSRNVERSTMTSAPSMSQAAAPARGGIPGWVWLAGLIVIGVLVWRMVSRRGSGTPGIQGNYGAAPGGVPGGYPGQGGGGMPMQGYGPQQGMGQPGYGPQPGRGSGMLGTGMAVAGGVAGGMLLDQMLNRHAEAGTTHNNLGGLDPNTYNPANDAASDLENRQVDFGSGGDSWDSGGGSIDSGGDSGGGGGWD